MSVGVAGSTLSRSIAAPAADAARVAAIRNNLNLDDKGGVAGFGEAARKALLAGADRLLAEIRGVDIKGAADRLRAAQERIEKLDPSELEPRGGLDNIFNGRVARLHRLRRAYEHAGHALGELAADLEARGKAMAAKSDALNGLHEQARALILELDAYLEAGRARLAEARASAPPPAPAAEADPAAGAKPTPVADLSPADRLAARLADLDRARSSALRQLPLVRVVQNADAFLVDDLARGRAALAEWRTAWGELLGMGRGDKIRPHIPALAESKLAAVEAIRRTLKGLSDGAERRGEAEARMAKAAKPD